jgi:hypothetical protein
MAEPSEIIRETNNRSLAAQKFFGGALRRLDAGL